MTDRDQFEAMLESAKADYEVVNKLESTEITVQNWSADPDNDLGYVCFYSCWFFDPDGKLTGIGHWE
jgi:hypothetical protein